MPSRGLDLHPGWLGVALVATLGCGSGSAAPHRDASALDRSSADVPQADASTSDGADAGGVDATPPPPGPYPRPTYLSLAETGLFADAVAQRITDDAIPFEPTYWLWSDGAEKRRWLRLPPGTQIDTTAMDHWVFPIGTKLWKEFSLGGVLLETRLIERYGDGPEDYWMGAFVWNAAQTDAVLVPDGQADINDTPHDAPAQKDCLACHRGDPGRVLGFSALQLSRAADDKRVGPTLTDLIRQNLLSAPPPGAGTTPPFTVPGDPVTIAALGYLHANCGHCHNENGTSWPDTQMVLRLTTHDTDAASSDVYKSLVGQPLQYWRGGAITQRVAPGDPDASAIVARMSLRGNDQMPPLATEETDPTGISKVRAWIASLPLATAANATR
jgi:hypothetical protein